MTIRGRWTKTVGLLILVEIAAFLIMSIIAIQQTRNSISTFEKQIQQRRRHLDELTKPIPLHDEP